MADHLEALICTNKSTTDRLQPDLNPKSLLSQSDTLKKHLPETPLEPLRFNFNPTENRNIQTRAWPESVMKKK